MSFSKAPIQRFNDTKGEAPAPGAYNPKFDTDLCNSIKRGQTIYKNDRFKEEKDVSPFAVPAPMSYHSKCSTGNRPGPHSTRGKALKRSCERRILNSGTSTQSLPSFRISDEINREDGDEEEEEEFELHRINQSELVGKLQHAEEELILAKETIENQKLQVDFLSSELQTTTTELKDKTAVVQKLEVEYNSEKNLRNQVDIELKESQSKLLQLSEQQEQTKLVLEEKLSEKEIQLQGAIESSNSLQNKCEELNNKVNELQQTSESQSIALKTLETKILEQCLEISSITSILEKERAQAKNVIVELNEKVHALDMATEELKKHQDLLQSEKSIREEIESKLSQSENKVEALVASSDAWKHHAEVDGQKLADLKQKYDEQVATIQNLDEKNLEMNQEIQSLNSKLEEERKTVSLQDEEIKSKSNIIQKTQQELKMCENMIEMEKVSKDKMQEQMIENENRFEAVVASLEAWKHKHQESRKKYEKLKKVSQERKSDIESFELKITEKDQEILNIKSQLEEERNNGSKLRQEIMFQSEAQEVLKLQIEKSNIQFESEQQVNNMLTIKFDETERRLQELTATLEVEKNVIQELQKLAQEQTSKIISLEATITEKNQAFSDIKLQLDEERHNRNGVSQELTLQNEALAVLKLELEQSNQQLESEKQMKNMLTNKCNEMERSLQELTATSEVDKNVIQELQKISEEQANQIISLGTTILQKDEEFSDIKSQLENERNNGNGLSQELMLQNQALVKVRLELEKCNENLESEQQLKNSLTSKFDETEKRLQELMVISETDKSVIKELQKVSEEQTSQIKGLETKVLENEEMATKLNSLLNLESSKNVELVQEVNEKKDKINEMEKKLVESKSVISREQLRTDELEIKLSETEDRLEVVSASANAWKLHYEAEGKKLQELQSICDSQVDRVKELEVKLAEDANRILELSTQIKEEQSKKDLLNEEVDKKTACIKDLEEKLEQLKDEFSLKVDEKDQALDLANANSDVWKIRYEKEKDDLEKLKDARIVCLQNLQTKLDESLTLQTTSASQSSELRDTKRQVEALTNQLKWSAMKVDSTNEKFTKLRRLVKTQISTSEEWEKKSKTLESEKNQLIQVVQVERQKSNEALIAKESELENLRKQNASLESLVGPFKQQLRSYEQELQLTNESKDKNAQYANDLATKYAQLLGHQNSKQKIHHLTKLKDENIKLKQELAEKDKQLKQAKSMMSNYGTSKGRRIDHSQAFRHDFGHEDTQNREPVPHE